MPKFKTCVEMSGARKKNVVSGCFAHLAELPLILGGRLVAFFERDQDLTVRRRDERAFAE
jgi:hypothetical protein